MASFDFAADREVAKMDQASLRATKLHIKRQQYKHSLDQKRMVRHAGEAVKPHRCARVAARTCLAKGTVEADVDMPSLVHMNSLWSRPARKPAVARTVQVAKMNVQTVDDLAEVSTDDEGLFEQLSDEDLQTPNESPVLSPQQAPDAQAELDVWPALSQYDLPSASELHAAVRASHRDAAIKGMLLGLEEEAARKRLKAKKASALRAAKESLAWKKVVLRKSHRGRESNAAKALPVVTEAVASVDCVADEFDHMKLQRAARRATNLHNKRLKFKSASKAASAGRSVSDGVKPHRSARAAVRIRLARDALHDPHDMPVIVCMDSAWSRKTIARKPAVASLVPQLMMSNTILSDGPWEIDDSECADLVLPSVHTFSDPCVMEWEHVALAAPSAAACDAVEDAAQARRLRSKCVIA
jgi:hypothetical protein